MVLPLRTKSNIRFDPKHGVWKYGKATGARTAKKTNGAMMLLRTMYVLELIEDMIEQKKSSTLREMYYISEGWDKAKFHSQDESNFLAEDLEIVTGCMREDFKLRPEENGASVIGRHHHRGDRPQGARRRRSTAATMWATPGMASLTTSRRTRSDLMSSAAKFVIAIETGGMFDRLVENGFDEDFNAVLVHLKGQPARCTRRFIKRLNEEMKLPVVVFTDGDPWSFRIFASVAYGAIKTAHISEYLATPTAEYHRHHRLGHHELRPADGQADRHGRPGAERRAQGPPVQRRFLARRDRDHAQAQQEGRTAGAGQVRPGLSSPTSTCRRS